MITKYKARQCHTKSLGSQAVWMNGKQEHEANDCGGMVGDFANGQSWFRCSGDRRQFLVDVTRPEQKVQMHFAVMDDFGALVEVTA
jgi:hypothetical protein